MNKKYKVGRKSIWGKITKVNRANKKELDLTKPPTRKEKNKTLRQRMKIFLDHGKNDDKFALVIFDENNKVKYSMRFSSFQEFKRMWSKKCSKDWER